MELKPLKSFVAVARLKSFSAAARELNTVQPAISRHIASLEEELDAPLFIRNTRDVHITAAGLQLFHDANVLLKQAGAAKQRAQKAAKGTLGTLRIGYLPSACLTFIPYLVRRFHEQYPQVDLALFEMTASEQMMAFDRREIDVGISRPLPQDYQFLYESKLLYADYLTAVVPEQHSLSGRKQIQIEELKQESLILFHREEAVGLFDSIISLCRNNQFSPHISAQPKHMQTLLTMVAAGLGTGIAPNCIVKLFTQGCRFIPLKGSNTEVLTQIHYSKSELTPTAEAFVKIALQSSERIQKEMNA